MKRVHVEELRERNDADSDEENERDEGARGR